MMMVGRKYSALGNYRFGFNGKENDDEVKGIEGGLQDYGMRIYDPRIGKFLSVDPLTKQYAELTPFQFSSNNPIANIDLDGLEGVDQSGYITNATPEQRKESPVWSFFRDLSGDILNLTPVGIVDNLASDWDELDNTERTYYAVQILTSNFIPGKGGNKNNLKGTGFKNAKEAAAFQERLVANVKKTTTATTENTINKQSVTSNSSNSDAAQVNSQTKRSTPTESIKSQSGRTIINSKWKGQQNPKTLNKGFEVPYQWNGYPDFTKYLYTKGPDAPGVIRNYNTVEIKMTGNYQSDYNAANKAAGFDKTPEGYTWHHTEIMGKLQLVSSEAHKAAPHSGGVARYKELNNGKGY